MSTPARTILRTLDSLPEDPDGYAFVDYGCGKGRAVLLAATRSFRRVIGVEHAPTLVEVANRNIATWRGPRRCADVRVIRADASAFELPPDPCVLYFFAPFEDPRLLDAVLANIAASFTARPRPMYAIYVAAVDERLPDEAMLAAGFRRRPSPPASRFDPGATRRPVWFAIYERHPA